MVDTLHSPYIHAANKESFPSLVLENSNKGPVLVNFWSRKAGPSLRQYPVLDKLVHDYAGRLLLVNIDTEKEFVYTKEYCIASVPTLKLFRFGKVAETQHGHQSEADLKKTLDLYVSRTSDTVLAQAIHRYAKGETSQAYEVIVNAIVEDSVNPRLPAALCKLLKHEARYDEALQLIDTLPANIQKTAEFTRLHAVLGFYEDAKEVSDIDVLQTHCKASSDDLHARRQLVACHVTRQCYDAALHELSNIMECNKSFADNYAQKAAPNIFEVIGQEHPLAVKYRANLKQYAH